MTPNQGRATIGINLIILLLRTHIFPFHEFSNNLGLFDFSFYPSIDP